MSIGTSTDYLRAVAEVRDVFYTVTDSPLEGAWSQALAQLHRAHIPIAHFGSSDCRSDCGAPLVALPHRSDTLSLPCVLEQVAHAPIVHWRFP